MNGISAPIGASQMVLGVKNLSAHAGRLKRHRFDHWFGKIPWRRAWQHTPVFLLENPTDKRSLVVCSPQDDIEADTAEAT